MRRALREPILARLSPDFDRRVLMWRREATWPALARTQSLCKTLRSRVFRIDAVDNFIPSQCRKGPIDRRVRGLGGVAAAPSIRVKRPADLVAGPSFGLPGTRLTQPPPAGFVDYGKHREPLYRPCAGHLQETPPRARAVRRCSAWLIRRRRARRSDRNLPRAVRAGSAV